MIIVTAEMWPQGNQAAAYEILTASVTNNGAAADIKPVGPDHFQYLATVLSRPDHNYGTPGFQADIDVPNFEGKQGFIRLLMSILAAAISDDKDEGILIPPSILMNRGLVHSQEEYNQLRKGR